MSPRRPRPLGIGLFLVAAFMAGCSSYRATPVDARPAGTLNPSIEDPDAGLVGSVPGFDLRQYRVIVVDRFQVAPNEIKDARDIELAKEMSGYLQAGIVAKIGADPTLPKAIDASATTDRPTGSGVLLLQGDISRLTEGSQALRYLVGFGAGTVKAQVETRFVDGQSGQILLITADRREAAAGGLFGGDSKAFLVDFMNLIADGLVKLLHRLEAGGHPGK